MYCKTVTESKLKTYQTVTKIHFFEYILLHECTYVVKCVKTCFVISAEQLEPTIFVGPHIHHLTQERFMTNRNFKFLFFILLNNPFALVYRWFV